MDIHRGGARGYELAGRDYEQARPLYPNDAIALLVTELGSPMAAPCWSWGKR